MAHKEKEKSLAKVGVQGRIGAWLCFKNLKKEGIEASHKLTAKLLCELVARRKSQEARDVGAAGSRRRRGKLAAKQEARGTHARTSR